jgi:hypothetical protein
MDKDFTPEPFHYIADFKNLVEAYPRLAQSIYDIMSHSPTGQSFMKWALNHPIGLRESRKLGANENGNCDIQNSNILITVNEQHEDFFPFLLCHEIGHAFQHLQHNAISRFNNLKAPLPFIISGLYFMEASVNVLAARILFEMKLEGAPAAFDIMKQGKTGFTAYKEIFTAFEETYESQMAKNNDKEAALAQAGNAAFSAWFNKRNMMLYAEQAIMSQLNAIYPKRLIIEAEPELADLEALKATTLVHPSARLYAQCPFETHKDSIFENYPEMAKLAEAAEVDRQLYTCRPDKKAELQKQFADAAKHNPFMLLNFADFIVRLNENLDKEAKEQDDLITVAFRSRRKTTIFPK